MHSAKPLVILEQQLVLDREQRAAECREDRQLIVWPFDGRKGRAESGDLFTGMEGPTAYEQM